MDCVRIINGETLEAAMDLRMTLDDQFAHALMAKLRVKTLTDAAQEAFTILSWAVQERELGKVILSATPDGKNVARLAMPALERIFPADARIAAE